MIRPVIVAGLLAWISMWETSETRVIAAEADASSANFTPPPPPWLKAYRFPQSTFTFVRVKYGAERGVRSGLWATDYPDADLKFAAQLGRITSLDVSEPSRVFCLTDVEIFDYPALYVCEAGGLSFRDDETAALRKYLEGGGFLFGDDFWGEDEWRRVQAQMREVLPNSKPVELPLMHPLFRCVFELTEKPQVPSIHSFMRGRKTERADAVEAHYWAYFDKEKRMVALFCQNTDLGDGWERAGVDPDYTREVSVAKAFPMGINIVFFALTQNAAK
jgi:hypothetical protein